MSKRLLLVMIALAWSGTMAPLSHAADPVDLSGKQGVVDPAELKKNDPPPPKVVTHEPPPPPPPLPKPTPRPSDVGAVRD
jgi:hypothetical protein